MTAPDPRASLAKYAVVQGDPLTVLVPFVDSSGAPVAWSGFGSGWAAKLRVSPTQEPPQVWAVDTSSPTQLTLSLTGAQTDAMSASASGDSSVWKFDLQATGGVLSPFTVFIGAVTVWKVYTRA